MANTWRIWLTGGLGTTLVLSIALDSTSWGLASRTPAARVALAPHPFGPPYPTEENLALGAHAKEGHPKIESVLTELSAQHAAGGAVQAAAFANEKAISLA